MAKRRRQREYYALATDFSIHPFMKASYETLREAAQITLGARKLLSILTRTDLNGLINECMNALPGKGD